MNSTSVCKMVNVHVLGHLSQARLSDLVPVVLDGHSPGIDF